MFTLSFSAIIELALIQDIIYTMNIHIFGTKEYIFKSI
jgi:hypothetical protein